MRLGFSVEFKHKLLPLIQKDIALIPATMNHIENSSHIDLFIRATDDTRIGGIISTFNPIKRGGYYIVRVADSEFPEMNSFSMKLLSLPSSVPGELYVTGDRLFSSIRFHHSDLEKVSGIAGAIIDSGEKARLEDLGPSFGGINTLDSVNSRIPLTMISFTFLRIDQLPEGLYKDHYGEVNIELIAGGKYRVTVYPIKQESKNDNQNVVSAEDGIYSYLGTGKFQQELFIKSGERRIPVAATISKVKDGSITFNQFIPKAFKDEQLSVLFETARNHPSVNFRLTTVRDYDSTIWEWL